jgi:hypothetical protein
MRPTAVEMAKIIPNVDQRFDQRYPPNILMFPIFQSLMGHLRNIPASPPSETLGQLQHSGEIGHSARNRVGGK